MKDLLKFDELLTDEQKMIRDSVREFCEREVNPLMMDAYEKGYFPPELVGKIGEMSLFGSTVPEEYGGQGLSYMDYGVICQELERSDSGLRSFISVQSSLCMYPILRYGSEEQKKKYLPAMAAGKCIGCFGLTEPNSGSDPGSMKTFARKAPDGWILNGSKMWITNAPIADVAIVWANSDEGIRGFLVEKERAGMQRNEIKHKMSLRASSTGELVFDNCHIPAENMLQGTTKGLAAALSCLTQARYGIAWGAIGSAMACFDAAAEYTDARVQFNKPLSSFQLVQKDLAEMFNEINKAWLMNYRVGQLMNEGRATHEMVSLIKGNACREAIKIARSARNLLGGNGISLEYPVIRHMMNLEAVFTYEGTDNVHNLVLGRYITGHNAFF